MTARLGKPTREAARIRADGVAILGTVAEAVAHVGLQQLPRRVRQDEIVLLDRPRERIARRRIDRDAGKPRADPGDGRGDGVRVVIEERDLLHRCGIDATIEPRGDEPPISAERIAHRLRATYSGGRKAIGDRLGRVEPAGEASREVGSTAARDGDVDVTHAASSLGRGRRQCARKVGWTARCAGTFATGSSSLLIRSTRVASARSAVAATAAPIIASSS